MKLRINYDLIEAVKNVNEPFGPFKIVRNNKRKWIRYHFPLYFSVNYIFQRDVFNAFFILGIQFGLLIIPDFLTGTVMKIDIYSINSSNELKKLSSKLCDLNIDTNYDLLLKSYEYKRKYQIQINEQKLPELAEYKYILVPTYKYNGDIGETSLLQEHIVGSKIYTLSIGSPLKEFKLAYSKI